MKCRRCGREFTDPVPEVTTPSGNREIACVEWCPGCNTFVMNVIFRWNTAYAVKHLEDPLKGGYACL